MPSVTVDGIPTSYEVIGSGPPLLMCSPGGFNAVMANWRSQGIYADLKLLDHLPEHFTCIVFDRRESGLSGGRLEKITWDSYAAQARDLVHYLGFESTSVLGGCMGCPVAIALALSTPRLIDRMVLFWPVGGAHYRIRGQARFAIHQAFSRDAGLREVVKLAQSHDLGFGEDPRIGPWGPVLRHDEGFTEAFVDTDPDNYQLIVSGTARSLHDRDTAVGGEPEDLMRLDIPALIVPGHDRSHPTSSARFLEECLPVNDYWDLPVEQQAESNVSRRIVEFLEESR